MEVTTVQLSFSLGELERLDREARFSWFEKVAHSFPQTDKAHRVALMYGSGFSQHEVAMELGLSRPTVQHYITRVLGRSKKLREELEND